MADIKLLINSATNGFTVEGDNNNYYPYDGQLFFPFNSVIVVTDDSDMVTFRSASNFDVLFSGQIGSIEIDGETVTKATIATKFSDVANQESGGGGGNLDNYYTKSETNALLEDKADVDDTYTKTQVDDAIDNAIENIDLSDYYTKAQTDALIPDVSNYFDGAEYDSQTKHINFLHGQTVKAYIDATAFIKDGMVDSVAISAGNLVITFNTDAGKEPITIPLTDIFNPANYYDKTTADSTFATQVVVNQEIAARIAAINGVNDALLTKADKSDTYTKTQVDSAISTAVENIDLTDYATKAELSTVATTGDYNDLSNKPVIPTVPTNVSAFTNDAGYLTEHQSLDNYYTKTQVDTALAGKVSQTVFDTKEEVISTALNDLDTNKQDVLTAGTNITIQNNVISATGGTQQQADWNQTDNTQVDYIKNKPTIPDTSDFVSKAEYNPKEVAIATALTELNDGKADKSTTYTKTEVDTALSGKQAALVSGTNIKTINNESILGSGNITIQGGGGTQVQSDWNQTDNTQVDYIKNKPTIPDVSTFVTKTEADIKEEVISTALNNLNTTKANASSLATVATTGDYTDLSNKPTIPDVSNYYTKSEVDTALGQKVTNGGNITTIMKISQSDYTNLQTKDNNTLYIIV